MDCKILTLVEENVNLTHSSKDVTLFSPPSTEIGSGAEARCNVEQAVLKQIAHAII